MKKTRSKSELAGIFDDFLKQQYQVSLADVLQEVTKKKHLPGPAVPLDIFSTSLSTLESLVKYLHEVKKYTFAHIAELLNRNPASLASSYKKSLKKSEGSFTKEQFDGSRMMIPLSVFSSRTLSPLESLVSYLIDEENMRLCDIARILNKDQRTIWTVKKRARNKIKTDEKPQ